MGKKHKKKSFNQPSAFDPTSALQQVRSVLQSQQNIVGKTYSGPIPPPEMLDHFERVFPGLAKQIVDMAERQLAMVERQMDHRHGLEKRVVGSNTSQSWVGLIFAFILGMTGLVGSLYLIYIGRELGGGATFLGSLGALIGLFFYGRKSQSKELAEKRGEK